MLSATLQLLREREFVRGEDTVDRRAMAARIAEILSTRLVQSADEDEVQAKALLVPEISFQLLGEVEDEDVDEELVQLVRALVGAEGYVQAALEDGRVLCSARVSRRYDNGNGGVTIRKAGRFVSDSPEAIELYYEKAATAAIVRAAMTAQRRMEIAERRQPALGERRRALVDEARKGMRAALPVKAGDDE
jgi:hypothetical protein